MAEAIRGDIHKVCFGNDLKMCLQVGTNISALGGTIIKIIEDKDYVTENGTHRIMFIVKDNKTQLEWCWTEIIGLPCTIQYAKPNENPTARI